MILPQDTVRQRKASKQPISPLLTRNCNWVYYLYTRARTLSGVGTKIDPTLCRADRLVGQVLGAVGALPDIYTELEISYFLLRRLLGVRTEGDKKGAKVC